MVQHMQFDIIKIPKAGWFLKAVCAFFHGFFFFLFVGHGLNSGFCICKVGALPLEPHLQSILLWLFWRWSFMNYFSVQLEPRSS
jgi:hypothetical protein